LGSSPIMGELADYLAENDQNFRKARLPALYSDFRPQLTLNPDGYRANISAWRLALSNLASRNLLPSSSPLVATIDNGLLRQLESKQFGQPLALGTAVREAVAARELVPFVQFMQSGRSVYTRGWGDVPWNVASWALRQLGVVDPSRGEDRLPAGRYVVMDNLEAVARQLQEIMAGKTSIFDRVFTRGQFQNEFATELVKGQRLDPQDINVLLRFLSRDKHLVVCDEHTIRFVSPTHSGPINEQDSTIASLKELTASLRHQTSLLEQRIDTLTETAKSAVAKKNRVTALATLKSKKLAESSLATRYATLNQLEEVATKIETASDNAALVKVMESSAGVLEGLNKSTGGAERVDGVMDRLREQMTDTDEVAAILAEGGNATVDETEIDDELEAMLAEEKGKEDAEKQKAEQEKSKAQEREAQRKLADLPDVPTEDERTREKTPTSETGIGNLSMEDKTEREAPVSN